MSKTPTLTSSFNLAEVRAHLEQLDELGTGEDLTVRLLAGGRSNLTFELSSPSRSWVLRRPPAGELLETAHDMRREVTVQAALASGRIPVPRIVLSSANATHSSDSYYIMEKVEGRVLRTDANFLDVPEKHRETLSFRYIDALAQLHTEDVETIGLSSFGRPDGFLERQVRRWSKQLEVSRSQDLPELDRLADELKCALPRTMASSVVHGDFRFDNMIVQLEPQPEIAAILDWEMATLGDPLTDLGLVYVFWEGWHGIDNPIAGSPGSHLGYPTFDALAQRYSASTGAGLDDLEWYNAFAFFKMAVILESINTRFLNGETVGDGFETIGSMVSPLTERGLAMLAR
ncbi:phosphotransferase family protein [Rhodococcus sp. IEGM 1366]|uniref:phosphotransferase family protein n=1 Tax=Rhodococcus sp. IEGM 1366 TaxID=3082223 RepID=UPI00295592CA|nr:phosphotransferase family protein [Rhodococcus sp. IEGM 1366]MDV8071333.1 phosphotransferase family protein [Rhodococcus sp. IEGM 1366]